MKPKRIFGAQKPLGCALFTGFRSVRTFCLPGLSRFVCICWFGFQVFILFCFFGPRSSFQWPKTCSYLGPFFNDPKPETRPRKIHQLHRRMCWFRRGGGDEARGPMVRCMSLDQILAVQTVFFETPFVSWNLKCLVVKNSFLKSLYHGISRPSRGYFCCHAAERGKLSLGFSWGSSLVSKDGDLRRARCKLPRTSVRGIWVFTRGRTVAGLLELSPDCFDLAMLPLRLRFHGDSFGCHV